MILNWFEMQTAGGYNRDMIRLSHWAVIFSLLLQGTLFQTPLPGITSVLSLDQADFEVRIHPDQPLQVGDQVSFEIFSRPGFNVGNNRVSVDEISPIKKNIGLGDFNSGADNRFRAVLQWVWDTRGLAAETYTLQFSVIPLGIQWQQMLELKAAPLNSPYQWAQADSDCCTVHYITGTAAERDLNTLMPEIDNQVRLVENQLGHTVAAKIEIELLPRIVGQGGFTSDEILLSYLDNSYLDENLLSVLHHELVHRVDLDMGGDYRPLSLIEGLAVYMTGGHYHPEPLGRRAAALVEIGAYVPLMNLVNEFYNWQHEAGYLEAGALVEYMVNTWGWTAYNQFYRDIHPVEAGNDAEAINRALTVHFGLSLRQLDDRYRGYLESIPIIPALRDDILLTTNLFDTIREYQQVRDPSAYFQEVWLPDPRQMRKQGIIADYFPRDGSPANTGIEAELVRAGIDWDKGDYAAGLKKLQAIQKQLKQTALPVLPVW